MSESSGAAPLTRQNKKDQDSRVEDTQYAAPFATASENEVVPHVHNCTGPSMTCQCGYVLRVGRFLFSVDVYDNQTKEHLVNDGFNCEHLSGVIEALERIIDELGG